MNIYIRWAHADDAEILAILNEEFNGPGITALEVRRSLEEAHEFVAIALIDDVPAGFACAQCYSSVCYPHPQGEITELYINRSARRKGAATLLLAFLEQELRVRGVKTIKVLTGNNNALALKLYERSGYLRKEHISLQKRFI